MDSYFALFGARKHGVANEMTPAQKASALNSGVYSNIYFSFSLGVRREENIVMQSLPPFWFCGHSCTVTYLSGINFWRGQCRTCKLIFF